MAGVGDDEVAAFCERVRPRLVGALTLACGDRRIGEDLAQDTLVRVWERWPQVSAMTSPEGWTFRTGFNLASSWRRGERPSGGRTGGPAERPKPRRSGLRASKDPMPPPFDGPSPRCRRVSGLR